MLKDGRILLGKAGEKEIMMQPRMMNRHGLIAGASGTGKTVTLKVIAESLSEMGVPTFIADVKSDLSGMIVPGDQAGINERFASMGITGNEPGLGEGGTSVRTYPVHFFDVFGETGHPIRGNMERMDQILLTRILDLTDAQEGVLNIIFRVAEDMQLDIIDLKDLEAMTLYVGQHAKEYTLKYGNVTAQSVGALQRKLLQLENEHGDLMFGLPAISIDDLLKVEGGKGVMSILECSKLFQQPLLYSTFLLYILDMIYDNLPEVGDLDKPKLVFFFDEAHLLFNDAKRPLKQKIEQMVKLIRSKGVGVFFCTQLPSDIPGEVLGQLSNRVQHALRAYTPAELRSVKTAADSFRPNPEFKTEEIISTLKTGHALVSALDEEGAPCIVEETKILPPFSSMKAASADEIRRCIESDSIAGKYEAVFDPESAYEMTQDITAREEKEKAEAEAAEAERKQAEKDRIAAEKQREKDAARAEREAEREAERRRREAEKKEAEKTEWAGRIAKKAQRRAETEIVNFGFRSAKKMLKGLLK